MKEEMKGLYAAIIVSMVVIFATNWLFPRNNEEIAAKQDTPSVEATQPSSTEAPAFEQKVSINTSQKNEARIQIENTAIKGSLRVKGARFDDIYLTKYKKDLDPNSEDVELFYPAQTETPYYAEFGWLSTQSGIALPNADTSWKYKSGKLTPHNPVVLEWNNGQGIKFIRKISIDDNYMFSIEQIVENNSGKDLELYPYGLINRSNSASEATTKVVHEGLAGVIDETLKEIKLDSFKKEPKQEFSSTGGWIGFSDHYWLSALILDNNTKSKVKFAKTAENTYQTDFVGEAIKIENGSVGTFNSKLFTGAKEIRLLDKYTKDLNIEKFDLAVDFGWYYFLTKPFFYILDFLYRFIGNMGWAILLFAALLRLAMFPIANKSFESMSKMKKVQPKIQELQNRFKDDKVKLQTEMMNLYRKEQINPASGCLPMFIQIPVFFSLYKVLNIAIEIRHAPFIGWIKDLSAPDPLTVSAITGIGIPSFLDIGVWPILMGLTMYIQQKLNPAPANKDQARMFALMPIVFMFMLGHFASGLVIYWTLSNVLSIIQQRVIMKKVGV